MAEAAPIVVTPEMVRHMRYANRMMQLSTDLFSEVEIHRDDVPDAVRAAADRWYAFLSEIAEEV